MWSSARQLIQCPVARSFISARRGPVFVKCPASPHFPPLSPGRTRDKPPGLNALTDVCVLQPGPVRCQLGYLLLQGLPVMAAVPATWESLPLGPKWAMKQKGLAVTESVSFL